ncbi:vomeronasal type-2 receptor 26-like [Bombina bombina]|uniref:vomeronasal type-2 receptor 26-like n=1 Tax=Bombina bombina TaxID=8345 RepID=UPI00235B2C52|nr:vomeronasal type-2 receptor 26-like [Bombina bombina]
MHSIYLYPQYYRHLLAFIFAIDEINKNPDILPNITLGYDVYDSCSEVKKAIESVMRILSGSESPVPNYSCMKQGKVAGVIGDLTSVTSLPIAHILGVYGYTQISYGATDALLSDKFLYPSFFSTVQDDRTQYVAIAKLVKHFGWTWVGIIISDDNSGEDESQELSKEISKEEICIEFKLIIKQEGTVNEQLFDRKNFEVLLTSTSQIIIICGTVSIFFFLNLAEGKGPLNDKTLILPSSWNFNIDLGSFPIVPFNGSLSLSIPRRHIPGLQEFLENIHPSSRPEDLLLAETWALFFRCYNEKKPRNEVFEHIYNFTLHSCTGKENIVNISNVVYDTRNFRTLYHIYAAVYIMAHALHSIHISGSQNDTTDYLTGCNYKHKLQRYIRKVYLNDHEGEKIYFNDKGELPSKYDIVNRIVLPNGTFLQKRVGSFSISHPEGHQLLINQSDILWKNIDNQVPQSQCSVNCSPGFRRVLLKGRPSCCYGCVKCSEGEVSSQTDSDFCLKCPDTQWPNEENTLCVPRVFEFLSYETDDVAIVFSFFSIFFAVLTAITLAIFVLFRDTPIVRANNHQLSFLLLVSIMLSSLCVFLFLGRPVDITCMLRQAAFGIIFSIAVSSVLAKTIMVLFAFKATKPGNLWRKWVKAKLSNAIVVCCSSIQIIICITWLVTSPPFREYDTQSQPGKIIIQCNEGSLFAFYSVLGYMGFLASVSFIVAFMVRNLPDSFNEGKHITFSMLVFCCVWICVIPAYLSTNGKNMVAVEIFAILASSAGLLGCIFAPKCYIILIRPERNTKKQVFYMIKK